MENGEAKEEPKPEATCQIERGILTVTVPVFMPNGEYIAYGMLHKAANLVSAFFVQIEREARQARDRTGILTPAGMPAKDH